jgi:pseudouridine 5'-phosphatase
MDHDIPIAVFLPVEVSSQLATSSHRNNFILKTTHLHDKLFCHFKEERIIVGDDQRIPHGRGKPHPGHLFSKFANKDIYLIALSTINSSLSEENRIRPEECLVFEDAVLGVQSARNAGMQVVWVPDPLVKGVFKGQEKEILGDWGKEVSNLAEVRLEDYGIGADK